MTFDRSDIRPTMDVYTSDNLYLGVVLAVRVGPRFQSMQPAEGNRAQVHSLAGSSVSGELLGPAPTQTIGNTGPLKQSAREHYASQADGATPIGHGSIVVGKWYGLLGKRTFALEAVQTVSLERVVLRLTSHEL